MQRKVELMRTYEKIREIFTWAGACFGIVMFVLAGMQPAILYGGWTGLMLTGQMFGTPVEMTFMVKLIVLGAIVLGVITVGLLFLVLGAVLGSIIGTIINIIILGIKCQRNSNGES